eukprot:7108054-Prymnesium_polylepis.2
MLDLVVECQNAQEVGYRSGTKLKGAVPWRRLRAAEGRGCSKCGSDRRGVIQPHKPLPIRVCGNGLRRV